jgi:hypothetical protein
VPSQNCQTSVTTLINPCQLYYSSTFQQRLAQNSSQMDRKDLKEIAMQVTRNNLIRRIHAHATRNENKSDNSSESGSEGILDIRDRTIRRIHRPMYDNEPQGVLLSNGNVIPAADGGYGITRTLKPVEGLPHVQSSHCIVEYAKPASSSESLKLDKELPLLPDEMSQTRSWTDIFPPRSSSLEPASTAANLFRQRHTEDKKSQFNRQSRTILEQDERLGRIECEFQSRLTFMENALSEAYQEIGILRRRIENLERVVGSTVDTSESNESYVEAQESTEHVEQVELPGDTSLKKF